VVDLDAFAMPAPEGRERASHIVAVANLEQRKGHDYLIEAVRLLIAEGRDVALTIVGEGPERTTLEAQADGMPVRLVGPRSREQVRDLLRNGDVFALATLADTFGVSPVEAMAAGVPAVVTSAAGCAGLIEPLGARVVPPREVTALRDALADLLDNPVTISAEAVEAMRNYCGSEAVGERLDGIYRSVTGR
jgi:glycosyltransferase involved in cell wall biosynthesis